LSHYGGNAWGFAQFADDLRREVGGKLSIMGLYRREMIVTVPELPTLLPKLIVLVHYSEIANTVQSDLKFVLTFPEGSNEEESIPPLEKIYERAKIEPIDPNKRTEEGDPLVLTLMFPFVIAPFPVFKEGAIKVRCHYDDGSVLKMGRLNVKIKSTPDPTASTPPASQSRPAAPSA
jgi:hypothetical protein